MSATKGWKGALKIADSEAELAGAVIVGYIDSIETNMDSGLEEVYHLKSWLLKIISEGNVTLSVSAGIKGISDFVDIVITGSGWENVEIREKVQEQAGG